jgi:hypothetical protein
MNLGDAMHPFAFIFLIERPPLDLSRLWKKEVAPT